MLLCFQVNKSFDWISFRVSCFCSNCFCSELDISVKDSSSIYFSFVNDFDFSWIFGFIGDGTDHFNLSSFHFWSFSSAYSVIPYNECHTTYNFLILYDIQWMRRKKTRYMNILQMMTLQNLTKKKQESWQKMQLKNSNL